MSEMGDLLCDIAEAFAPSFGKCAERCEHNGICSLEADHELPHIAKGSEGQIYCRWPEDVN